MIDYEVQRCTRHCAVSGKPLVPGESFYSVLLPNGGDVVRADYSAESWTGPPAEALGWWKHKLTEKEPRKPSWAPNDLMLDLLESLAASAAAADMRYVLSLLLVRRRVLRLESTRREEGAEINVLYCSRRETTYEVRAIMPTAAREQEIQAELSRLLWTSGT